MSHGVLIVPQRKLLVNFGIESRRNWGLTKGFWSDIIGRRKEGKMVEKGERKVPDSAYVNAQRLLELKDLAKTLLSPKLRDRFLKLERKTRLPETEPRS